MTEELKARIAQINAGTAPAGYKKTKVGIVPDTWRITTCGQLGKYRKGKEVSSANTTESGLPAMMYGDIYVKYDTKFYSVDYRISQETANKSTPIHRGDLLFTCSGETALEIGKCVVYLGDETVYIGGDILALTPANDDSVFLAYQQNSHPMIKQKARLGQGHSVVHIYAEPLKSMPCALPPLPEQKKIAEILTAQDSVISLLQKRIELKQQQKKALMQKLLSGEVRVGSGEWKIVRLGDLCSLKNGFAFKSDSYCKDKTGKYNIITISNVQGEQYIVITDRTNQIDELPDGIMPHQLLQEGDLLISLTGNVGRVSKNKGSNNLLNQRVGLLEQISDVVTKSYLYFYVSSSSFEETMKRKGKGEAQSNISKGDVENHLFSLPCLTEQEKITEILSAQDREIELLQQQLALEQQKKKALMQLLLTGKVRCV